MSNPYFEFKQFTIWHDKCAMKVGTDSVILGAWASVKDAKQILDVGTGTGLITLLLAQRNSHSHITAIEIDSDAAMQAQENISRSPWSDRISIICNDFRIYKSNIKYDLIISNPPYFIDSLRCPDKQRNAARHADTLNYEVFFHRSAHLLCENGSVDIIIPAEVEKIVIDTAWKYNLFPSQKLKVYSKPEGSCRRVLISFSFQEKKCVDENLCIRLSSNEFTPEYIALTRDFYLKM